MHISRFTGLSMTTISHWLANVQVPAAKDRWNKFLKNLDTGHPVFFVMTARHKSGLHPRTSATSSHTWASSATGFVQTLSTEQINNQIAQTKSPSEKLVTSSPEEDLGTSYQCKLAIGPLQASMQLNFTSAKLQESPEDHLLYVSELEKQ